MIACLYFLDGYHYPFAFIYEEYIQYCHCKGGNTYLELVYQYTTFTIEQSLCKQTFTTSINSKVCDMMVDSYILSETFMLHHVHARQ